MCDGFNRNYASLNGLVNLNCDELVSDNITFNYLDNVPESYFDGITSNIQTQLTNISGVVSTNTSSINTLNGYFKGSTIFNTNSGSYLACYSSGGFGVF